VAIARHKQLMWWKLAMEILANFFDALRVSRLGQVRVKPTWIAFQQVFPTTEVQPSPCSHWRRNALTTTFLNLQWSTVNVSDLTVTGSKANTQSTAAVQQQIPRVIAATGRIATAAQIDLSYSPVGANVPAHLIYSSLGHVSQPSKGILISIRKANNTSMKLSGSS